MKKFAMVFVVLASTACGIPVSQECKDVQALTDDDCAGGAAVAETYSTNEAYKEGGTCWTNAETAQSCTDACKASLDACTGGAGGDAGT